MANPYEIEWTKKNGEKITTFNSPNNLLNEDGVYIGSFAIVKDIAELKRVKTALSEREEELIQLLLEALNKLCNLHSIH